MRRLWDAILVLLGRRVALPVDFPARRERLQARCRLLSKRLHEARAPLSFAQDQDTGQWWLVRMVDGEPATAFHPECGTRKAYRDTFARWSDIQ